MKKKPEISQAEKKQFESLLLNKFEKMNPDSDRKNEIYRKLSAKHFSKINRFNSGFFKMFFRSVFLGARTFSLAFSFSLLIVLFGITTGFAYFSPSVTKDSNIYFLKEFAENIEMSLTFSEESKSEKLIKFAERRREELDYMIENDRIDQETIQAIMQNTQKAMQIASEIEDEDQREKLQSMLKEAALNQQDTFNRIIDEFDNQESIEEKIPQVENNCVNYCKQIGQRRCAEYKIEECVQNKDGCLNWQDVKKCSLDQYCEDGKCLYPIPDDNYEIEM